FRLAARARHHDLGHHHQRIHRGGRRPLYVGPDRARPHPVRHHLHRPRRGPLHACPDRAPDRVSAVMDLYARRKLRNRIVLGLSFAATGLGLGWLVLILGALVFKGASGLSLQVFTEMTPPPGADGGLLNPIVGSLILTGLAVLIGTPVGILAGTYMAEYGRFSKLTQVVRFINDVLLSAPSIVIGLFVYEVM